MSKDALIPSWQYLFRELQPDIAKAVGENVTKICLVNEFDLDGHHFKWKRINRGISKQLDKLLSGDWTFPEDIKGDEEKKAQFVQKEYLKLCFEGFTDDVYENIDMGALEVLFHAPIVRQKGLFRQGQ